MGDVNKTARDILNDILLDVLKHSEKEGDEFVQDLYVTIIAGLTASLTTTTLSQKMSALMPKEEKKKQAMLRFAMLKEKLTTGVAMGFSTSVSNFTGKDMDYYCTLQIVPEGKSKAIN